MPLPKTKKQCFAHVVTALGWLCSGVMAVDKACHEVYMRAASRLFAMKGD